MKNEDISPQSAQRAQSGKGYFREKVGNILTPRAQRAQRSPEIQEIERFSIQSSANFAFSALKITFVLCMLLSLSACGTWLAGDITPPPGYVTPEFVAPAVQGVTPGPAIATPIGSLATELPTGQATLPVVTPNSVGTPAVQGVTPTLDLSQVQVTTDTSGLVVERLHVILDFPTPGTLQVAELFIITNNENKMVVPVETGKPILEFELPAGATNLQFQDGELGGRFVTTPNGFGDTQPIPPGGGNQVVFVYSLPYSGEQSLALTPPLRVLQEVVMLPAEGVSLQSQQLQDAGTRAMQTSQGAQGSVNLHLFAGGELAAGAPLEIKVSGFPFSQASQTGGKSTNLVIGLAVFGLALIGVGLYYYFQQPARRRAVSLTLAAQAADETGGETETRETLLDAIVALDDLNKEGKLAQDSYTQRRAELIKKLKENVED